MDSVWFRTEPAHRPRLSRKRIVQAAVGLLDVSGLDGFSMRALARRLGVAPMSVYEYVSGRADVLDFALDAVIGEIEPAADGMPWRDAVLEQLCRMREVMLRHRWMPTLMSTRPLIGPNALRRSERFHASLIEAGLTGATLVAAVGALTNYAIGFAAAESSWWATVRTPEGDKQIRSAVAEHLAAHAPLLAQHAPVELDDFDEQFRLGAEVILDGIAMRSSGGRCRSGSRDDSDRS